MALFTKSVQEPKTKDDGIRICIMRRPGEENDWQIWMPTLAPSHQLLTDYHQEKVNWQQFCKKYAKQVFVGQKKFVKLLIHMAKKEDVTILCWEDTPEFCHRRLLAEECIRLAPDLKVTIK